jgi:hypothetical protein
MLSKFKKEGYSSLFNILFVALFIRIIAAIFSEGYMNHDDHFLVVEASGSWIDGFDYNAWLPWNKEPESTPEGHSFTYVGFNFGLFWIFKFIGIADPKILMLLNRLVHALISILVVRYAYKITLHYSDKKTAATVGWMLALFWAFPFLSVRNLVEVISMPFLIGSVWFSLKNDKFSTLFCSGVFLGIAISCRYQIAVYAVGIGLYFLFQRNWKKLSLIILGSVFTVLLTQGLVDYLIWGYPFAEFLAYTGYNMVEGTKYMENDNYFMYFYVLFGFMLFPLGILGFISYFYSWKKYVYLFLPTFLFLMFHTVYPNRQERFIITILPIVLIIVILGIQELRKRPFFEKFWNISWYGFWIINIPVLLIISTTTTKKSRMDSMYALYGKVKGNEHILIEATGDKQPEMLPYFYSGKWQYTVQERRKEDTSNISMYLNHPHQLIFFLDEKNLKKRINNMKVIYPKMKLITKIEPSRMVQF